MNLEDILKEKLLKQETQKKKEEKSLVERSVSRLEEKISTLKSLLKELEGFKYLISNPEYVILYDYKFDFSLGQFEDYNLPTFEISENEKHKWKELEGVDWHPPSEISKIREEINQIVLRGYKEGDGLFGLKRRKREKQIQALDSKLSKFLSDNEKIELLNKRIEVLHKCRKDIHNFFKGIKDKRALDLFLSFYKSINHYGQTFKEFVDNMTDLNNAYKFVLSQNYNKYMNEPEIKEMTKRLSEFDNFLYNISFNDENQKILLYGLKEKII